MIPIREPSTIAVTTLTTYRTPLAEPEARLRAVAIVGTFECNGVVHSERVRQHKQKARVLVVLHIGLDGSSRSVKRHTHRSQ